MESITKVKLIWFLMAMKGAMGFEWLLKSSIIPHLLLYKKKKCFLSTREKKIQLLNQQYINVKNYTKNWKKVNLKYKTTTPKPHPLNIGKTVFFLYYYYLSLHSNINNIRLQVHNSKKSLRYHIRINYKVNAKKDIRKVGL